MPEYHYSALDMAGRTRNGRIVADTGAAARDALLRKQLFALSVDAAERRAVPAGDTRRVRRLNVRQLTLFTRQLATLVQVVPIEEALRTIVRQSDAPQVQAVFAQVHADVVAGRRLSEALAPQCFPPLYRAMVAAGESAGSLPEILERLALLLERQASVRGRVIAAIAYPAALAVVASIVVVALMVFVVPRVVEQFDSSGQTLPLLTRMVIGVSGFLAGWGWLLLLAGVAAAVLAVRALRDEALRLRFDGWLLRLPLLGRLLRDLNAARLARTLATMVASRLPVIEGLALASATISNRALRRAADDMVIAIREGGSLSAAMRRSGVFPPLLVTMAAGGESAGRLDLMLERAADYLEREFDIFTATALSLLEPAVIIAMGGVVATIVLSILLPILQLDTLAGQ